jgi:hypothetical protein
LLVLFDKTLQAVCKIKGSFWSSCIIVFGWGSKHLAVPGYKPFTRLDKKGLNI